MLISMHGRSRMTKHLIDMIPINLKKKPFETITTNQKRHNRCVTIPIFDIGTSRDFSLRCHQKQKHGAKRYDVSRVRHDAIYIDIFDRIYRKFVVIRCVSKVSMRYIETISKISIRHIDISIGYDTLKLSKRYPLLPLRGTIVNRTKHHQ